MVPNDAGGFGFELSKWSQLDRFLILGTEGGTYYVAEQKLTEKNAASVIECIKEDGKRTVDRIVAISREGRAVKNDPAIFALALASTYGNAETKGAAYSAVSAVCRTGTMLFTFTQAIQDLRSWSRGLRRGVGDWYTKRNPEHLAFQVVKYRQRNGWTHRDVLRLTHPKTEDIRTKEIFQFVTGKIEGETSLPMIEAFRKAEKATAKEVIPLIKEHGLPWEAVSTDVLKDPSVWEALLESMPPHALIRNLGRMGSIGLLKTNLDEATAQVVAKLSDSESLKRARLHPLFILNGLRTYQQGRGVRGKLTWSPVQHIVDTLDDAFYAAFQYVEPTNQTFVLGIDVSGSMGGTRIANMPLSLHEAAGVMAMVAARTEPNHQLVSFDTECRTLHISPKSRLADAVEIIDASGGGGTDCAQPILWAMEQKLGQIDNFVLYTDDQTWAGHPHPIQAAAQYRKTFSRPGTKLISVAMAATRTSVADKQQDPLSLAVVGFDTGVADIIREFCR